MRRSNSGVAGKDASTSASASTSTKRRRKTLDEGNKEILPDDCWEKILESVDNFSVIAFASVCKQLRRVQKRSGRRLETNLEFYKIFDGRYWIYRPIDKELTALSKDWCLWSMSSLTVKDVWEKT